MKNLTQFLNEKLHVSQYKGDSLKEKGFIIVIAYRDLYNEFLEYFEDALIKSDSYPDIFLVHKDDIESYINVPDFYAYDIPNEYKKIEDFEQDYEDNKIDPEELEETDFRNYFK